jgi:hypothetical protein
MRLAYAVLCLIVLPGAAGAAEGNGLPDFFDQSFEAVAAKPLAPYSTANGGAEETGAIPSDDVPLPPKRPGSNDSSSAFALKVPENVQVKDARSFVVEKRRYVLASTDGLGLETNCTQEANGHCIFHPMRALKQAIAGRTLQCRSVEDEADRIACGR